MRRVWVVEHMLSHETEWQPGTVAYLDKPKADTACKALSAVNRFNDYRVAEYGPISTRPIGLTQALQTMGFE